MPSRLRIFVGDKIEIFEYVADDEVVRKEYELGQTFVDYIYGNFTEIYDTMITTQQILKDIRSHNNVEENINKLLSFADILSHKHIYFYPVAGYITDLVRNYNIDKKISDVKYLSHIWVEIRDLQETCLNLISSCFDINERNAFTLEQKYYRFLHEQDHSTVFEPKVLSCTLEVVHASDFTIPDDRLAEKELKKLKLTFVDVITPKDIFDIIYYFATYFLKNNIKFRKCKNCDKYFAVTGNAKIEYCNRPIIGSSKTCKEIGALRIYQIKKFSNPANKAYNTKYKTQFSRMKSGKITQNEFKIWAEKARKMRDECIEGADDFYEKLDALVAWLKQD